MIPFSDRPSIARALSLWCAALLLIALPLAALAGPEQRQALSKAALSEDANEQLEQIRKIAESPDPIVGQALTAWRQGGLFASDGEGDARVVFFLDLQSETDGMTRGIRVIDGEPMKAADGKVMQFKAAELTAIDTSSKLRKAIKTALDLFAISDPDPHMRRDAIVKLGQDQNAEYLPFFQSRAAKETDPEVKHALEEATALTQISDEKPEVRIAAVQKLAAMRSINSLGFLQKLETDAKADLAKYGEDTFREAHHAVVLINDYMFWGNLVGTAFRGFSLSAVLLVAALGLAITFGLMGVINMAHGEVMMVGAYAAFVTQNCFKSWFGASGLGFDAYFLAALVVAFVAAALVGLILERGVIRFLYSRPLESMLATWGVSLVLQQIFRDIFGAANVQVNSPSWLSGSFVVQDVLFAYNRIFVIFFAVFTVLMTYFLLSKTSMGLQVRAVMQNRNMASCLGVRTERVNMVTFAFGSGLAGMAGACLSQIGNVGPSLGQNYIVDCFMVVVLGGVGNLIGTISASLGVGVTDQILQPFLGAVMGKITVLGCIILFLQWRPAGLFVTRTRSLED